MPVAPNYRPRSIIDDIAASISLSQRQTNHAPAFVELEPHEVDMLADETRLVPMHGSDHLQKPVMSQEDWRNVVMAQARRGELFFMGVRIDVRIADQQQGQAVA